MMLEHICMTQLWIKMLCIHYPDSLTQDALCISWIHYLDGLGMQDLLILQQCPHTLFFWLPQLPPQRYKGEYYTKLREPATLVDDSWKKDIKAGIVNLQRKLDTLNMLKK